MFSKYIFFFLKGVNFEVEYEGETGKGECLGVKGKLGKSRETI